MAATVRQKRDFLRLDRSLARGAARADRARGGVEAAGKGRTEAARADDPRARLREGLDANPGVVRGGLVPARRKRHDAGAARHAARAWRADQGHRSRAGPVPGRAGGPHLRALEAGGDGSARTSTGGERPHRRLRIPASCWRTCSPSPSGSERRRCAGPGSRSPGSGMGTTWPTPGSKRAPCSASRCGWHAPRGTIRTRPSWLGPEGHARLVRTPIEAARGAHVINTDVWASMGQEAEASERLEALRRVHRGSRPPGERRSARHRAALPACAPWRGDRRGRPGRPPVGRVRPGGEPAARAEGAARAVAGVSGEAVDRSAVTAANLRGQAVRGSRVR